MLASRSPVFSLVWYGKDRLESARQTVASLQRQTFGDVELLVEDCGSSDGTAEAFLDAAKDDPRIRVIRRSWRKPSEALLSAMRRARGEYVMVCPNAGGLSPDALDTLKTAFAARPETGGLCTRGTLVAAGGGDLKRCDIVALLFAPYSLNLAAVAMRRRALEEVGLHEDKWFSDAFAFDLCCRLAISRGFSYLDEQVIAPGGDAPSHDGLESPVAAMIEDRLRLVSSIFSPNGFFAGAAECLAWESKANQVSAVMAQHAAASRPELQQEGRRAALAIVAALQRQLKRDHRTLRSLHRLLCCRSHGLGPLEPRLQKALAVSASRGEREEIATGYRIWNFPGVGGWLMRKVIADTMPAATFHPDAPSWEKMHADLYGLAGGRYEARGQIDVALEMWDRARPPDDAAIDSMACQAMLKSPRATDEGLALKQKDWVRRHAGTAVPVAPRRARHGRGRIRIGYHCSFIDLDTMRNMMREVIASHDRDRFEVYAYGPNQCPEDLAKYLDVFRRTPPADCPDPAFADLVRSDEIDVFVELTGFSPGHRFGAMALRCAPVQVSFLNHTGTSQVPNVDYVISDEICIPTGSLAEKFYSEKIWRLPRCFFCFDYSKFDEPLVLEPPVLANGYITFGCFGSGGKIGRELIAIWAELLRRVPDSRLYLQNSQLSQEVDRAFIRDCFRAAGIPPNRLIVEPGVERKQLIRNYALVDISLDTWPYAGGNTIAESLWHGVPVVTYRGDRFSSAYGASLLTAGGCPELIGDTPERYVEVAAALAGDPDKLVRLRKDLRRMSLEHGLGDSKDFARRLEDAFAEMLEAVPTV